MLRVAPNWNVLITPIRSRPSRQSATRGKIVRTRIPPAILDGLTDIATPRLANVKASQEITAHGFRLPVRRCDALVLGSGAAGLRARLN